jgi:hypothetical protein
MLLFTTPAWARGGGPESTCAKGRIEGGTYDVKCSVFGAKGNGVDDDYTAITEAIAVGCASHIPVYFPPGNYYHSLPLHVPCASLELYGAGQRSTFFSQSYRGPAWIVEGAASNNLPLGPGFYGGNSLTLTGRTPSTYIMLSDLDHQRINGLPSFCAEIVLKMSAYPESGLVLNSVSGLPSSRNSSAFGISVKGTTGDIVASINLTSGPVTIDTGVDFTLNIAHDLALDYDGTTCRVFEDGNIIGTPKACSGKMVQDSFEGIPIPNTNSFEWPDQSVSGAGTTFTGGIDSITISQISRHTVNYTPPTGKLLQDRNTIVGVNFDTSPDNMQLAYAGTVMAYIPVRGQGGGAVETTGTIMHDMELCSVKGTPYGNSAQSDGLFTIWSPLSRYYNLSCSLADAWGFKWFTENYESAFYNLIENTGGSIAANVQTGIDYGGACAECRAWNNQVNGPGSVGYMLGGNTSMLMEAGEHILDEGHLRYGWVLGTGTGTNLTGPFIDMEDNNIVFSGDIYVGSALPVNITGGQLGTRNAAPYLIVGSGAAGPTIVGTWFGTFGSSTAPTEAIDFLGRPANSAVVINSAPPRGVPLTNQPTYAKSY